MHFERQNAFQNAYFIFFFFFRNKIKIFVPTLPKIFRPVPETHFFLGGGGGGGGGLTSRERVNFLLLIDFF